MGDVRVLAVQAPRMPAYDALKYFRKITESAASRDVDFVLFPEKWVTDELPQDGSAYLDLMNNISKLSRELGCAVIPGSFPLRRDGMLMNASPVVLDGNVAGFQEKISLFRSEIGKYVPGNEINVFSHAVKFAVAVCYDIDFPYYPKVAIRKGAELLLNPSLIQRKFHDMWHLYVAARSLENRIPVVSVNSLSEPFGGNSAVSMLTDAGDGVFVNLEKLGQHEVSLLNIDIDGARQLMAARVREDPGIYSFTKAERSP